MTLQESEVVHFATRAENDAATTKLSADWNTPQVQPL
jgi:hypothetical protein